LGYMVGDRKHHPKSVSPTITTHRVPLFRFAPFAIGLADRLHDEPRQLVGRLGRDRRVVALIAA
jgi:hypothetical protein